MPIFLCCNIHLSCLSCTFIAPKILLLPRKNFHFKRNFHRLFKLPSLTTHKLERTSVSFLRSPDSVYFPLIQHQNEIRPQNPKRSLWSQEKTQRLATWIRRIIGNFLHRGRWRRPKLLMMGPADKAFVKTFLSPPSHPQTVDIGVLNTRDISDVDI